MKERTQAEDIMHDRMYQIPQAWNGITLLEGVFRKAQEKGMLQPGDSQYMKMLNGGLHGMMNELYDEGVITYVKPEGRVIFEEKKK